MSLEMKTTIKRPRENSSFLDTRDYQHHGYECKTCRKRFTTYQALGGHQGIHKKIKSGDDNDACWLTINIFTPMSSELHRCKLCKKGFGSGQALGGHMRIHKLEKVLISMKTGGQKPDAENDLIVAEVQPLRMKAGNDERHNQKSELILAAKEWRLSI